MGDYHEVVCADCEWSGDGTGLTECPVCGGALSTLDAVPDINASADKYPADLASKIDDVDDPIDAAEI